MNEGTTNLRRLAALSSVVREVVDGIKAAGDPPVDAQTAGLDAVDAMTRGGKLTKAEAARLTKAASVETLRFNPSSSAAAEAAARLVSSAVGILVTMAARGSDDGTKILEYAGLALGKLHGLPQKEYEARTKESYAKALAGDAHASAGPIEETTTRVDPEEAAPEQALLAASRGALPPYAQALLDRVGAERDPKQVGTKALRAALTKRGYPAWPAVVRFNEDFGGLLIPATDDRHWRAGNVYSLVGPYAGLAAGGDRMKRDGLVPVYFGADDMIGFLDEKGRAWLGGVLDGQLTALHCSGAELVASCIAFELLQTGGGKLTGLANNAGFVGERIAQALLLERVASYGPARMWASSDAIVSELQGTQIGALTDDAWTRVQGALAALAVSPADLFKTAKNERTLPNVERAFAALVPAIVGCGSLDDVKRLFSPYVLAALQTDDGERRWRQVAAALIERAASMNADEGGRVMGWIARQGAQQVRHQGWEDPRLRRRAWCDGIDDKLDVLRRWLTDESPVRRAGAAYALAWCRSATKEDVALLLGALVGEKDADALATQLIVAGWLARSTGAEPAATLRALRGVATNNPLVATCAVAGLVWLGEPLRHDEVDVLLLQLRRSAMLPALWDLEVDGAKADTRVLAWDALGAMNVAEPERTIAAARAMLSEAKLPRYAPQAVKAALARAAFDGRRPVPREGVALEELSPEEREVLSVLVVGAPLGTKVLGLDERSLQQMVEQKLPEWRPLEIVVRGQTHHWHFARIVGAVGVGQVEAKFGRDTVLAAFTAAEAATLVTSSRHLSVIEAALTPEEQHRALSMCLAILDAAREAGVDLDAVCRDPKYANQGLLALWTIHAHDGCPPEDHYPLLDGAMRLRWWHASLLLAIRRLSTEVRAKIFRQALPAVLDFWDPLDDVTVPKLVRMAADHPKSISEVVALLAKGGAAVLALAESVTSDRPGGEANLAFVRDELRKARSNEVG